jgi:hypothetical protein
MKKLTVILALGVILYSCTETEKPDQLNLDQNTSILSVSGFDSKGIVQIPSVVPSGSSENAMMHATFTPLDDVSGNYTTETSLLDISSIPCNTPKTNITDGILTLDLDKTMYKRQADVCGWAAVWGTSPLVEGPNPHILASLGQNSLGITLSTPVKTFGFEMMNDFYNMPMEFRADFYSEGNLIGSITRTLTTTFIDGTARLFAATTDASFDYILIQGSSFAIGQIRYTLVEENPFTVDVKPDSCENPVNVNSKGVISVAILASLDYDVNDIDLSTVRLNGVVPQRSSISDLGGFYEKEEACDCDPKDNDGIKDLDLKFDTESLVASLGAVTDGQKVTVALTFDTVDGKSWTGEDCIWIIKKKQ